MSASGWAAPVPSCPSGTLADYLALTNGCTIGPNPTFTYRDFAFAVLSASGGATVLNPSEIDVTPTYVFSPGLLDLKFSSSGFHEGSGQSVQYLLAYTADPPPPEVIRFNLRMSLDPPVLFPGTAQITTNLCVYRAFSGSACPAPGVADSVNVANDGNPADLSDTTPDFSPVAVILGVRNTISLAGGSSTSDPAEFASFDNGTSIVGQVPEPASVALCVLGLCLMVFRMRRAHAKAR